LAESEPVPGGALLRGPETIDGGPAAGWVERAMAELNALENARVMTRTTVFGYYDNNNLAAVERVTDHMAGPVPHLPRQRLHVIRARRVVLATGAIERPMVFENNDRPGVMLAGAVRTYANRFAVAPGRHAVVFTNNDDAYRTALGLHAAGVAVAAIVDSRASARGALPDAARQLGIECLEGHAMLRAEGKLQVNAVQVIRLGAQSAPSRRIECDLVAVSGGWSPTVHLHSQAGGRPVFDEAVAAFVPGKSRQAEASAGSATGAFALAACLVQGHEAGCQAAEAAGFARQSSLSPSKAQGVEAVGIEPLWIVPGATRKAFVDIQDDVASSDVDLAHREGYVSVEHLKRFTTLGMGTDQGKTSNVNGLAIMAGLQGRSIAQTGTTTFRPPYAPVALGVFAGREIGKHYQPVRRSPMHDWHVAHGATMVEAGLWMRPRYYVRGGESSREAYSREAAHVRSAVGLIDVSTLGKIDIQGPDSIDLLERVYANHWRSLAVGKVRYGLMLREDGVVFDDGTTARLGEHHYFMTTTTSNAAKVLAHLEFLLQVVWPELKVQVTSVTEQWGTMALAGPRSRAVLARVIEGGDAAAADAALPHLGVASVRVAGVPCRVFRMTFSGELAYEIAAPADRALEVWEATLAAGRDADIAPYGTEAMGALRIEKGHVTGAEIDGRTTAGDLGMERLLSEKKDFVGRRLARRPGMVDANRPRLVGLVPVDPKGRLRAGAQLVESLNATGTTPMIGHVSSMTYSPALGHDIALGFVAGGDTRLGQTIQAAFPLANEVTAVRVVAPVFYDVKGERFRG
ncbi:MAG: glycine cleavage T C-terminal barrel domain-containing protein, partial [Rubrivivax sp.]